MNRRIHIVLLVSILILAGCGKTAGSEAPAEGGAIPQMTSAENVDTPLTETEQSAEIEGSTLNESNNLSETDFTGRYVDDLGTGYERSEMIITKQDDGNYSVDF